MKKRFRIITYNKGFITLYLVEVKKWLGWAPFSATSNGNIYFFLHGETDKEDCYRYIDNYCKAKGIRKDEIEVTEIDERKVLTNS